MAGTLRGLQHGGDDKGLLSEDSGGPQGDKEDPVVTDPRADINSWSRKLRSVAIQ